MTWLDCYDLDSALTSLATAIGSRRSDLERLLLTYDGARWTGSRVAHEVQTSQDILGAFGTTVEEVAGRLAGAHCFHGTRVLEPETFYERGVLPLHAVLKEIWATLRELTSRELDDEGWAVFRTAAETDGYGADGQRYRNKIGNTWDIGPNAMLIRPLLRDPPTGIVSYLAYPEIIEDIAWCYARWRSAPQHERLHRQGHRRTARGRRRCRDPSA